MTALPSIDRRVAERRSSGNFRGERDAESRPRLENNVKRRSRRNQIRQNTKPFTCMRKCRVQLDLLAWASSATVPWSSARQFSLARHGHTGYPAATRNSGRLKSESGSFRRHVSIRCRMRDFGSCLRAISTRQRNAIIATMSISLQKDFDFYQNEIGPAKQFIDQLILGDARTGLVFSPMQSGKTSIIACIFRLLRALIPEIRGVYICANDQIDLRRQNLDRLQHLPNFEVLSRVDRRTWMFDELMIVFYDENHHGDGVNMTINEFLKKNDVKRSPRVAFCGVSATPFSSIDALDCTIWPDLDALHAAGYNSPGEMLRNKRLKEADQLFERTLSGKILVRESANVYQHIISILKEPVPYGYGMIRATYEEATALENHLQDRFGESVFIKHWNMHAREFSPESFFRQRRPGVFTLVLVQHKARMGNTIDTEHCRFLYEYSPSAHLDTIMQSLLGRACGFQKREHTAIVYSNVVMAKAYTMFAESRGDPARLGQFREYCLSNKLKLSVRSTFGQRAAEYEVELLDQLFLHGNSSTEVVRDAVARRVAELGLHPKRGNIRTLSNTAIPARKKGRLALHPDQGDGTLYCGTKPGDWSAFIYDKYRALDQIALGLRKDWKGIIVKIAVRTDTRARTGVLMPTRGSLHHGF